MQLDKAKRCRIGRNRTSMGISSVAMEADAIINLPKFKSHQMLGATFAIKNMFGCISGKEKAFWHFAKGGDFDNFCEMLIDIYKFLNPVLTIIDGITAMDSGGPIHGRARKLGWLIGSTDALSCEIVCAKLVGMDERQLPIISTAKKIGFGISDPEKIDIVGDDFSSQICTDFVPAEQASLRFSLKKVCRSVLKQALIAVKSKIAKSGDD